MKLSPNQIFILLLLFSISIYILGWQIDIMDVDAAQYAAMSMEMIQKNSWIEFFDRHAPYLDKPPLVFWTAGLTYLLNGINEVSFRIPSFIFTLIALFSVYKISNLIYDSTIAKYAVLILATCQATFIMNHDCRTDTLLMGSVAGAIYGFIFFIEKEKLLYYLIGVFFVGMALLSKGPIGLIVPGIATLTHLIYKNKFYLIWSKFHLIGIILLGIILFPMCWGLYKQFGNEGLRFFFWTQSFGRITGESTWNNNAPFTFLFENLQWALLPFTLIMYPAIWYKIKSIIIKSTLEKTEVFSFWAFLIPLLALSTSKYQLPHYAFVTLPLLAILLASLFHNPTIGQQKFLDIFSFVQKVINVLFPIFALFLSVYCFNDASKNWISIIIFTICIIFIFILIRKKELQYVILGASLAGITANFLLNYHVYPNLLEYQSASVLGKNLKKHKIPVKEFISFKLGASHALDFYSGEIRNYAEDISQLENAQKPLYVFTNQAGIDEIKAHKMNYKGIKHFNEFRVTALTIDFLLPSSRKSSIESTYLIQLY